MSYRPRIPSLNDQYCQVCSVSSSSSSLLNNDKIRHLSCFSCEHCRLSMCYECFEKHTSQLIYEYSELQQRFNRLKNSCDDRQQYLGQFQEQCLRSVNSAFDEASNDLENLRRESINYVKQQFNDANIALSDMMTEIKPPIAQAQQQWTHDGITKNHKVELETQRKQIKDIEYRLNVFSSPKMYIRMSTFPRNKIDLYCQPVSDAYKSTKKFAASYPGKTVTTRCSFSKPNALQSEKIDVETEVEELNPNIFMNKQIQTDPMIDYTRDIDDDDDDVDHYLFDETDQINNRINAENCLSSRYTQQGTILTQNEVDRIASDGEQLLYYSDTSKTLCCIKNILPTKQANGTSTTNEISCRWPHHPVLDLIYSPGSSQFVCATKTGVYTCTVMMSTIDIRVQLTQNWSYARLSADKNYIWIWTDTPRSSQLRTYTTKTFDCIRIFNLNDYPRFLDNSTSFCISSNVLATLFQFRPTTNTLYNRKNFHLTLCDSNDLHELCTIRLGECDIDHEVRVSNNGLFFITNGRKKLWIVDQSGKKEYVKLFRLGRALTIHNRNTVIVANGTQQLQCVEFIHSE
ncbi:unnamed protein product [Rotaria socialis]|uniref:LIM zinc-binding domain-containing protein n=1 Tax=Rotaria socialis TaxID=392032 RepID=A0A820YX60_9BILA|nr:unnamed protein product [Rotaria socialis]CAF4552587.1 unnamed protein product [Rotaria socialis]